MTWRFKVQGVVFAIVVLAALALAAAANWVDPSEYWFGF
jgi:hypothetical protein